MRSKPAKKARRGRPRKNISLSQIKKAINTFISRTEKIVRKVNPNAQIVVPEPKRKPGRPRKKPRDPSEQQSARIITPVFRGKC